MYRKAKSCVKTGNVCSDYFYCYSGVRQGGNLSPVLFAIYLNDLQEYMAERSEGLPSLGREARGLGWEKEDESLMLKMFMLLYADDTLCSESAEVLQQALDALSDYCDKWSLRVNVDKTKVVVFSRGKFRKMPTVKYKGQSLEVVFEFQYLGVCFNYNNKFKVAQKSLYDKASRAMFGLLKNVESWCCLWISKLSCLTDW